MSETGNTRQRLADERARFNKRLEEAGYDTRLKNDFYADHLKRIAQIQGGDDRIVDGVRTA